MREEFMPVQNSAFKKPLLRGPIGFVLFPQFTLIALASAIEPLRIANRYLSTRDLLPAPDLRRWHSGHRHDAQRHRA